MIDDGHHPKPLTSQGKLPLPAGLVKGGSAGLRNTQPGLIIGVIGANDG